jgi:hypothetical protein
MGFASARRVQIVVETARARGDAMKSPQATEPMHAFIEFLWRSDAAARKRNALLTQSAEAGEQGRARPRAKMRNAFRSLASRKSFQCPERQDGYEILVPVS